MATPRKEGPRVQATALDPEYQAKLRAAIRQHGLADVATRSGLNAGTVCAIAAGVGAHESSKKLARIFIAELNGAAH